MAVDGDLDQMSREDLLAAAREMRAAIRKHRDASGHDLCWYHPEMRALLPDTPKETPSVPAWDKFMQGCVAYRASLDIQATHMHRTETPFSEGDTP